ncbi:MAG: glycosyltransferase family 2 protein [Cyanobacteria bacterium REEB67]|nr:glycosyltransferase family 2 protein [Cyanobacteria bacterium REEB67]
MQSTAKALPKVTVQVLHWRGLEKTRACLQSLMAVDYANLNILLVANGAEAGDAKVMKAEFPGIDLLELDQNYGFAGGSNRGLKHAIEAGADFVWLLNNDATVPPETLAALIQIAMANPGAGALGATVLEGLSVNKSAEEQATDIAGVGAINYGKAKTYLRKLPGTFGGEGVQTFHRCDWLSGSNLLLRTSALAKIGLFDERYFLYFEDVDLCLRLGRAGFACLLVPGSTVVHEGNASTQGGLSLWRAYYHTRNRLLFFMSNAPAAMRPLAFLAILGHFARHSIALPFRGKKGQAKLYAEWLGLRDYFKGRVGQATCLDWCEKIDL